MSIRSERDTSLDSEGCLSWHGSFVQGYNGSEEVERQHRMSSATMPGGGGFEKGKWVRADRVV